MTIAENISRIKSEIGGAELVAVTKTHDASKIREVLAAGQRIFGENRVQEAAGKYPQLREDFPNIELHLIGPLQTNKVKEALALFDVIETLDREKLAIKVSEFQSFGVSEENKLSNSATQQLRTKKFFIQVNIGNEPQKAGIAPERTEEFFKFCTVDLKLNVTGLMCIPPVGEPAFMYFALLKNIKKQIEGAIPSAEHEGEVKGRLGLALLERQLKLSMGMSADYKEAVEMGADYVRIGSAIFGERL